MKEKHPMAIRTNGKETNGKKATANKATRIKAARKKATAKKATAKKAIPKETTAKEANATKANAAKTNVVRKGNRTDKNKIDDKLTVITPSGRKDQSFFQLVYEVARQIPKGRVTSYGAIAACLGTRLSARMVGWAMNGAHNITPEVPAHRVVNRNGMLSGKHHFETPEKMKELLEKEGTSVIEDTVVNFKEKFWDPASGF